MDINPDEDADAYETVSPASGEQAGVVHDEDQREFQETPVPDAVRRSEQLELQQRIPRFGALESGTERAPTQNVTASLAGISTGGAVGTVPEFVQQLKEWTLAQGERLGNGVQQLDDTTRLEILAQAKAYLAQAKANLAGQRTAALPRRSPLSACVGEDLARTA